MDDEKAERGFALKLHHYVIIAKWSLCVSHPRQYASFVAVSDTCHEVPLRENDVEWYLD